MQFAIFAGTNPQVIMEIVKIFRDKNLKKTTPRVMIVTILLEADIPLSEGDLKDKMGYMYDRSTFYRSMQALVDAEIIHRIVVDNTNVKYAINKSDSNEIKSSKPHAHFYCRKCNTVTCLDTPVPGFILPANYEIEECNIVIKGLCEHCKRNTSK